MRNSNGTIGNRARDLLACIAVPQPTASHRNPPTPPDIDKNFQFLSLEIPKLVRLEVTFTEFSTVTTTSGTTITRRRRSMPAVTVTKLVSPLYDVREFSVLGYKS